MMSIETILFITAVLLFLSVVASKISDKFGVPVLIFFLTIGMLAGSEGFGGINFDDPWLAKSLGTVALIFILFAGGFDTNWKETRHVIRAGFILATIGVLMTAVTLGLFASYVLKISFLEGLLLGSIVSSTDAAAVFNILRSRNVSLRGKLKPLLELESGSNDPMAVFLTIGVIGLLQRPDMSIASLVPAFVIDMGIGTAAALAFSRVLIFIINHLKLSYEGLYPALLIALSLFTYTITTALKGNGFLAVYLTGIFLGNANLLHKKTIGHFYDGTAWLMQIVMFLALGLLVFPSQIFPVIGSGLLISAFLMFVARPLSVFVCLAPEKLNLREKTMISWVGLRGAVPIILATFPLLAGIPRAETIFNIVFFIVLTSVIFQGTSLPFVSKLLNVDAPLPNKRVYPLEFEYTGDIDAGLEDLIVPYNSKVVGKRLVEMNAPQGCLIVLISRDDKFFIPNGSTILQEGDVLLVLADKKDLQKLQAIVSQRGETPRAGPRDI